jgi:hypothetical protein
LRYCGGHFENGDPISSQFYMWVDNDVLNWFPTLKKFYRLSFSKWPPQYHTNSTLSMATSRNFSMSGINSGHHYLPTYQILMISDNVEFLRYCGGHFENSDQFEQFLLVAIFKMATTISQKFNFVQYHHNLICG